MSKPNNPPLFTTHWCTTESGNADYSTEITLRDLFAAFALSGFLGDTISPGVNDADIAKASYTLADAMLAERSKEQS